MRWWDGVQWTSMVSENGVPHDENVIQPPMQPALQQAPMVGPPMMAAVAQQPPVPKRNNALIAIVAAVLLVLAGVAVFLFTKDDGGGKVSPGTTTDTTSEITSVSNPPTTPTTPITASSGHDSQTPEGQAYVDAMMQSSGESGLSPTEARCVAEGAVDTVGVQTLKDAGMTPEMVAASGELLPDSVIPTEAQANAMLDMMFGCVDFGALMAAEMGAGVLPQEQVACIGDGLETDETFRAFLISSMIGSGPETEPTDDVMALQNALIDIVVACGVDPSTLGG